MAPPTTSASKTKVGDRDPGQGLLAGPGVRVVVWGTYDIGKPRGRLLLAGLRASGVEVIECRADVWSGIEDKSRVSSLWSRLRLLALWLASYPGLIYRYLRLPRHDVVLIGYMGQLDVVVMWPFARLRGVPVAWDLVMSIYAAVVDDRGLLSPRHPLARLLYAWEWLAFRAADLVIANAGPGADYLAKRFGVSRDRIATVFLGAETSVFPRRPLREVADGPVIHALFYGTFIPSHGVTTIIEAARLAANEPIRWTIIGGGQEEDAIRAMLRDQPLPNLTWIPWVRYEELASYIHKADICLGLFGSTVRAGLTIPNKVFQVLATGTPIITRDSPGIRQIVAPEMPGVYLVPPADPGALVAAIRRFRVERSVLGGRVLHRDAVSRFEPRAVGRRVLALITDLVGPNPSVARAPAPGLTQPRQVALADEGLGEKLRSRETVSNA